MENKISQANKYLMTVPVAVTLPVWLTFLSSITFLSDTICSSKIVCRSSLVQYFPQIHWLAVLVYEILSVVVVQWQERWGNYRAVCPLVSLQCIALVNAVRPLICPIVKKIKKKGKKAQIPLPAVKMVLQKLQRAFYVILHVATFVLK